MKIKVNGIIFKCDTKIELARAQTLLTKEPGTVKWLADLKPGEVLWDIGANIGCYTLLAAKAGATVYAFEPHVGNAHSLMRNVGLNHFENRVTVVTSPLHNMNGLLPFSSWSPEAGCSGNQLGQEGKILEFKATITGNDLSYFPRPHFIKIDVDGNEPLILQGLQQILQDPRLRSIQVEIQPGTLQQIDSFLTICKFRFSHRHDTAWGTNALRKGIAEESIAWNAVYYR